jgi:hypothetical protein
MPLIDVSYTKITSALPFDTNIYGLGEVVASSGFRRDVLNGTIQTMWNLDAADPLDENMSVLSFPHKVSRCILLYLVTARIPFISNIAGSHPQTVSNLTASSSPGACYPFYLLFADRAESYPVLQGRTSSSRHRHPRISL